MKTLIIDDEPIAQDILKKFCARIPFLEVVACCDNAIEGLQAIRLESPDLIFLDIQMPEMTGVDMLRVLRQRSAQVIFTTAFPQYALDGFELEATDYLLKPIPFERFVKAVDRAYDTFTLRNKTPDATLAEPSIGVENRDSSRVWVKEGKKMIQLSLQDIVAVQAMGDYVHISSRDNGKVMIHATMAKMEALLPAPDFLRVNRSTIIRRSAIRSIQDMQIETTIPGTERISIGPTYWDQVKAHIKEWIR